MKKVINWFKNINWGDKFNLFHYVNLILLLFAFTIPFISGSFTKEAQFEELSNYISNRVADSTVSGKYMAISITDASESGVLPESDDEFYKTYGVFKQQNVTFCSGYNMHKNNEVNFSSFDNKTNLSIIYTGVDNAVEYNGHFKHATYPFELMFNTPRLYNISSNMIYISQTQADVFLSQNGIKKREGKYNSGDYESLIKQTFQMNVNGTPHTCVICNVYYEQNHYYNTIKEIVGDFVLCAYYNPTNFPRENVYFFYNEPYQTSYFMNYINDTYSNKKYDVKLLSNNFIKPVDEESVVSFYYDEVKTNLTLFITIVVGFLLLSVTCLFNFLKCWRYNLKYLLSSGVVFLIPYIVFLIISRITMNVLLFSNYGIRLYVFSLVYYAIATIVVYLCNKIYDCFLRREIKK